MILFHGTSAINAKKIEQYGFAEVKNNWKVTSKNGFVYLSTAYAPFYAMNANKKGYKLALIKVKVDEFCLFPDDDFLMRAMGKPVYTQTELDKIELEDYQQHWIKSLEWMGNVAAYPDDIEIIGTTYFSGKNLLFRCDPTITPINYKIMGGYYKELTEWLYQGNPIMSFKKF